MTKVELVTKATRTFARVGLKLKKYSPEIMTAVGTVGVVASGVIACKATVKASEIVDKTKEDIDSIHYCLEAEDLPEEYTEEQSKKDLAIVYAQTGVKFVKLYGPSVLLGAASIGCIIGGHTILRKRNVALAAAYRVVDKGFKEYRGRVVERFGKELDRELRFNIKAKDIEEKIVDSKGKEKTIKKTVDVVDPTTYNEYSRCFDNGNPGWDKDPEYNKMFLLHQQSYANDLLNSRGHVFLNEVYDMLGFPRTKMGNIVGWLRDDKTDEYGDGYIDFGIFDGYDESKRDFVNGRERTVWLEFNVDGPILDLI